MGPADEMLLIVEWRRERRTSCVWEGREEA